MHWQKYDPIISYSSCRCDASLFAAIETSSPSSTTGLDVKVASSIGSQTSDDNGSGTTAIVGAISGVVILTVATVILVLILRKKRPFKKGIYKLHESK